jgi:DNA repair protein REV1
VEDLPSVGYSIKSKIEEKFGTTVCGELLEQSKGAFRSVLGPKTGEMVYGYLRGVDDRKLERDKERKSISAEMNVSIVTRSFLTSVWYPVSKPRTSRDLRDGSGCRGLQANEAG